MFSFFQGGGGRGGRQGMCVLRDVNVYYVWRLSSLFSGAINESDVIFLEGEVKSWGMVWMKV